MFDKQNLDDLLCIVCDTQARLHNIQCVVKQCLAPSLLNDLEYVANTLESVEQCLTSSLLEDLQHTVDPNV